MLCYGSCRNWYSSLSPHFCLLNFTKTPNCLCYRPSSDHWRNLLTPTSHHSSVLSHPRLPSHFRSPAHCSETSSLHVPLLTLLSHAGLPAVPPTWQVSSFLRTPASDPLPQVLHGPHLHVTEIPWGTSSSRRQPGCHPLCHIHSHKNRSSMKAGPCPPAAQAPTHIGHIETWAGRQQLAIPTEWASLTQVLGYPTSLLVLMQDPH